MSAVTATAPTHATHIGQMPAGRQFVFYFQFIFRFLFAWLVTVYAGHFGVAGGWLSYQWALAIILVYSIATTACMLVARQRRFARTAQKFQLTFDLGVLAFGLPLDPNPGLPLMFVFYLVFLDLGARYGFQLYLRQSYGALVAIAIMIYLRAFHTDIGFTALDAWQVLLFLAVLVYGLQVFSVRDRATRDLRETQARLQLAMESPGVCAWYSDSPLDTLKPEDNFHRLVGLAPGQLTDRMSDYLALIHPDDRAAEIERWLAFVHDGAEDYESKYRLLRSDGEVLTVSSRARARRDRSGRVISVSGMLWDLTDQKRHEEAMLRMEERYRLATQSAQVGVWIWDIVSDRFENDSTVNRYLGRPPDATATLADVLATIHPEDRAGVAERFRALSDSDQDDFFDEHRVVLPSGEVRVVHVRGTVFRDRDGRAIRMAGANVDATNLAQARRALEDKTRALERSNRELDDFSYIASHDLKEPLRGISNYAQFLEEDYGAKLDDKARGMLLKMREQTRRMETLIMELLEVSRLSRAQLDPAETDLQATLDEVLASLEFSIAEQRVQIRIPRPLPRMRCDRVRVGELFRNLVTNAIKYNDKAERWVEIGYTGTPPGAFFFVRDNGVGIKAEHHDRVFTLFQRLHTREAFGGGSGVGLTIAKKIVEMHEGRIWLQSEPGVGTTFYFTLGKGAVL